VYACFAFAYLRFYFGTFCVCDDESDRQRCADNGGRIMVRVSSHHLRPPHHLHDPLPLNLSAPGQVLHQQNGKNRENRPVGEVKNPFNLLELQ